MHRRLLILLLGIFSCAAFANEGGEIAQAPSQEEVLELVHSPVSQLNPEFLQKLIRIFNVDVFIETSTYLGETSSQCSKLFKEVYTIENNHKLFVKAKKKFKNVPNVHCLEGDVDTVLKKYLPKIHGRILFWMVSHHKFTSEQKGLASAAIRKELDAIKQTGVQNSVILINQIQGFPCDKTSSDELCLNDLQTLLQEINPSYNLWILGDIAIAIPDDASGQVSPFVKACTLSRFFHKEDQISEVLEAEKTLITSLSAKEHLIIDGLHEIYNAQKHPQVLTLSEDPELHYILWKGLSLLGQKDYFEASRCFHSAIAKGLNHWRVYWYVAQSEYERRNLDEAQKALQKVLREAPDFAEASVLAEKIKTKSL